MTTASKSYFMKYLITLAAVAAFSTAAIAEDVTLTGEGKCLKCALKKSDKCQNVVEVKDGDKTTVYRLVGEVSKKFHGEVCSETKKVTLTGKLEKKGEDMEVNVAKIEVVK
jgi:uncharacterized protein YdeI (BOF family)